MFESEEAIRQAYRGTRAAGVHRLTDEQIDRIAREQWQAVLDIRRAYAWRKQAQRELWGVREGQNFS